MIKVRDCNPVCIHCGNKRMDPSATHTHCADAFESGCRAVVRELRRVTDMSGLKETMRKMYDNVLNDFGIDTTKKRCVVCGGLLDDEEETEDGTCMQRYCEKCDDHWVRLKREDEKDRSE